MLLRFAGALATLLLAAAPQLADEPKAGQETALADLSLDVQAFRAIYMFKLTDAQLQQIATWAKETSAPRTKRPEPKAGANVRNVLTSLRAALLEGTDDDKIGTLEDELDQIVENDNPKLEDSFDITKAARKRTPQLLKDLKADQLAAFAEYSADDLVDPVPHLVKALEQVRGLKDTAWTEKRDEIADDIAWAVAGVNQAAPVIAKVNALLTKARAQSDTDFKTSRPALEKEAKDIVGEIARDDLLRHHAERAIADMLSNPRLQAALRAKMK